MKTLYKARNSAITFFDDYSTIESEAKILTPKQILRRLPIAFAQLQYIYK